MKDKSNIELTKGDVVLFTPDRVDHITGEVLMFLKMRNVVTGYIEDPESEEETGTMLYYPLTKSGLEVAKSDNGEEQSGFFRKKEYTVNNVCSKHLLKVSIEFLSKVQKSYYDELISRI